MEAPEVEMCPDCGIRPARPGAKGRRCEACAARFYLLDQSPDVRERRLTRERERMRKKNAEQKQAGPQFFTPPS